MWAQCGTAAAEGSGDRGCGALLQEPCLHTVNNLHSSCSVWCFRLLASQTHLRIDQNGEGEEEELDHTYRVNCSLPSRIGEFVSVAEPGVAEGNV